MQSLLDMLEDGVIFIDREWRITYANDAARRLNRIGPHHIDGPSLWQVLPDADREDSPFGCAYRLAMEQQVASSFEAYYPEPLNLRVAGGVHPSEDGIIIIFRDVTQQRKDAEDLRHKTEEAERQAAEIEAVYRTAPIGLALFDAAEFRYQRLNERQAAFFGLKPEQVLGHNLTEMAPIPGLHELFEQVREGVPVVNYPLEGELISHPGEHRYWTVNYFPVYGPDGKVQAISAASLEITQQKKAERALIQSEKLAAAGRLASSISHEINNPLESVTNLLYLTSTMDDLPEQARSYVEQAQAELARVSRIATQTLRFYRQAAKPSAVTAEQMICPVLDLYRRRLTNAGVAAEMELASTARFQCQESEIRQVLSNLISNAIDAMPNGGRLFFRAHDAVDWKSGRPGVRITVADSGGGMKPTTCQRIFEPFFTTKELNGTGLGLWISQEIVHRHKGYLIVRSSDNPKRHGTVFWLWLPLEN